MQNQPDPSLTPSDSAADFHPIEPDGTLPRVRATEGMLVFDRDDVRVGTVVENFGGIFRVDAPWKDLWLGYDTVRTIRPGQYLILNISCDEIDRYRAPVQQAS